MKRINAGTATIGCSTTYYLEGQQGIVYLTDVDLIAIVCWKIKTFKAPCSPGQAECCEEGASRYDGFALFRQQGLL